MIVIDWPEGALLGVIEGTLAWWGRNLNSGRLARDAAMIGGALGLLGGLRRRRARMAVRVFLRIAASCVRRRNHRPDRPRLRSMVPATAADVAI
jgi:hypothetical protein